MKKLKNGKATGFWILDMDFEITVVLEEWRNAVITPLY